MKRIIYVIILLIILVGCEKYDPSIHKCTSKMCQSISDVNGIPEELPSFCHTDLSSDWCRLGQCATCVEWEERAFDSVSVNGTPEIECYNVTVPNPEWAEKCCIELNIGLGKGDEVVYDMQVAGVENESGVFVMTIKNDNIRGLIHKPRMCFESDANEIEQIRMAGQDLNLTECLNVSQTIIKETCEPQSMVMEIY